jgi:hypothetical protein
MSHIPNSAIPHAGPTEKKAQQERKSGLGARAGKVAELARDNPKTAIAAGAAVVAGLAAAAAIPIVRSRKGAGAATSATKKSAKPKARA